MGRYTEEELGIIEGHVEMSDRELAEKILDFRKKTEEEHARPSIRKDVGTEPKPTEKAMWGLPGSTSAEYASFINTHI